MISTTSPTGCCTSSSAWISSPTGRISRKMRSSSRERWGPPPCSITTAPSCAGIVLEEGGPASHVAIIARALGIPAVGKVENATSLVEPGDAIIADGVAGEVQIRPRPDVEAAYAEKARLRAKRQEQYRALRDVAPVTADGCAIDILLNAGLLVDLPHLEETGAHGIGLFRTEIQFMVAQQMPSTSEQQKLYRSVLECGR